MDNPFYTISLQIAKLQESVDNLLASKPGPNSGNINAHSEDITFSRKELASYLRCSLGTIDRYKKNGVIPYIQAGRTLLFNKSAVDKALASDAKKKGASK